MSRIDTQTHGARGKMLAFLALIALLMVSILWVVSPVTADEGGGGTDTIYTPPPCSTCVSANNNETVVAEGTSSTTAYIETARQPQTSDWLLVRKFFSWTFLF